MRAMVILLAAASALFAVSPAGQALPQAPKSDWLQLFNGKNLDGWVPKFSGFDLGVNYNDTFRVKNGAAQGLIRQVDGFRSPLRAPVLQARSSRYYIVAAEYRFVGEQIQGGPGWALRNNGVMLHCQAPETMGKDQDFPISVEAQLLGGGPTGERTTANMCSPGTEVYQNGGKVPSHCINSTSKTYRDGEWVRVEIEVHGRRQRRRTRIDGKTVLEYGKLQIGGGNVIHFDPAVKKDGTP